MQPIISIVGKSESGKTTLLEGLIVELKQRGCRVDVPQFSRNEVPKITDLIERTLLARQREEAIDLFINDTYIPINQLTKSLLIRTLVAMVSGLKSANKVESLRISLRRRKR